MPPAQIAKTPPGANTFSAATATTEACGPRPCLWLMKTEPAEASVDDFAAAPGRTLAWTGVRNYQARNFMRDLMQPGDGVLLYHSSCAEPGIAGLAEIAGTAHTDTTQFDAKSPYFDGKSSLALPRWLQIDVRLLRKLPLLPLAALRTNPQLNSLRILQRGNRLSITPVTAQEWAAVLVMSPGPR